MEAYLNNLSNQKPASAGWYGWTLALSATFASSIVTPLVRGAVVGGMDPISLLLVRLLLAMLLLAGTMAFVAPEKFKVDRRGRWLLGGVGLISGIEICCFFWSLAFVDSSMSAMIKSVQPLVVLLLLTLRGERLLGRHLLRLALAGVGIYLLVGPEGNVAPFGLFLLALSILLYAAQLAFLQWWLMPYDGMTVTLYLSLVMTVVITVWWWVQGGEWHDPGRQGWLVILVLAVVSTYFARLAQFAAIRRMGSGQIAMLWPLQTLLIILLSVLFLGERMTPVQWLGGALILSSALLAFTFSLPNASPKSGEKMTVSG